MSNETLFTTKYTTVDEIKELSNNLNEPNWLLERRLAAFNEYNNLPIDKDTIFYKYTTFRKFNPENLIPTWKTNQKSSTHLSESQNSLNPDLIQNEDMISSNLAEELSHEGVIFDSLHNLLEDNEKQIKNIISRIDDQSKNFDKLGSLTKAFASNVILLYVPRNISITKPLIKLTSINENNASSFSEFIALFEEGSNSSLIDLLQKSGTQNKVDHLYSTFQSIYLSDNANVKFSTIQDWGSKTVHIMARNVKINRYASIRLTTHIQGGQMSRHNSYVDLFGQNAEAFDLFIQLGNDKQRYDVKSEIQHNGKDTLGQTHARTVMIDKSEAILRGLISIPESGVNADSWLSSKGMTIGRAKISAVPSLKILQNDVKAAHAASVEPLNDNFIFYLQSRGITANKSKEIMVKGYFEPILKLSNFKQAAELSRKYLSNKWDESYKGD